MKSDGNVAVSSMRGRVDVDSGCLRQAVTPNFGCTATAIAFVFWKNRHLRDQLEVLTTPSIAD